MPFPAPFLEELAARNPIEDVVGSYVALTRRGSNLFGLCPFHNEKTPSFSVAPDKQMFYCFGCGKGGGVVSFIMEEENLGYGDAVRFLARRVGMEVPEDDAHRENYRRRERLYALCRDAARFFHRRSGVRRGRPGAPMRPAGACPRAASPASAWVTRPTAGAACATPCAPRATRSRTCWTRGWRCAISSGAMSMTSSATA